MKARHIETSWIGRIDYTTGLGRQLALVEARQKQEIDDTILLLEHEPVYTIGRTRDRSSLRDQESLPYPIIETNRGGQATFHGPGQLVGYFILDLTNYGKDLHTFLRAIEQALIDYAISLGIPAERREGLTGVWVEERKLASIGIGVKRWVSMHGFGLNVSDDLHGYDAITPCGISDVTMTSLSRELGEDLKIETIADTLRPFIVSSLNTLPIAGSGI